MRGEGRAVLAGVLPGIPAHSCPLAGPAFIHQVLDGSGVIPVLLHGQRQILIGHDDAPSPGINDPLDVAAMQGWGQRGEMVVANQFDVVFPRQDDVHYFVGDREQVARSVVGRVQHDQIRPVLIAPRARQAARSQDEVDALCPAELQRITGVIDRGVMLFNAIENVLCQRVKHAISGR